MVPTPLPVTLPPYGETMSMVNGNELRCPVCGSAMRPNKKGNGFNCVNAGRWTGSGWTGCNGVIWNNQKFQPIEKTPRATSWLNIARPSQEQQDTQAILKIHPDARQFVKLQANGEPIRSHCLILDAGPGCAKSTTMAWNAQTIAQRVGSSHLQSWHMVAFNVNAKVSLETKIPAQWGNIATINGFGGRLQGFTFKQYKTAKLANIFKDMTAHLPKEERPDRGSLVAVADRCRDLLLATGDEGDSAFWNEAIDTVCTRFPGIAKRVLKSKASEKVVRDYLPSVMVRSLADSKTIDLTEQYNRPSLQAVVNTHWHIDSETLLKRATDWTDEDVANLANLVRSVNLPTVGGVIVDEAQDLSLSQIVLFLAVTWRGGELILVGDDRLEDEDGELIKAGQAIFGWRGAFPGSLTLISRLWKALTGEGVNRLMLSESFRCPPEHCEAVKPLNKLIRSAKPVGSGIGPYSVTESQAFTRWLALGEGERALWLTRTNAPLGNLFRATIKARKQVCLRASGNIDGQIQAALYDAAGWSNDGEYQTSLEDCVANLKANLDETDGESLEGLLATIGEEILKDTSILDEAVDGEGKPVTDGKATVGNLRRLIVHFASKEAPRVLSTVYRAKGDEADLVIISNVDAFNAAWNDDTCESQAVRHVAATRSKRELLICGTLDGVNCQELPAELAEAYEGDESLDD